MASAVTVHEWIDQQIEAKSFWLAKRLSGNDTLANKSHQAGVYLPKRFVFGLFPSLSKSDQKNPRVEISTYIDSHNDARKASIIWYNGGTRNEVRVTGFGGGQSPLLDPESTGALAVFSFIQGKDGQATHCHIWVCNHELEAEAVEDRIGPVEPGKWGFWDPLSLFPCLIESQPTSCWLQENQIPSEWLAAFPSAAEIVKKTIKLRPHSNLNPDQRLLKRRDCEFELFRSVEHAIETRTIKAGFADIEAFIAKAQSILQRRKARSGLSLELQTREILLEERLVEGLQFDHQPKTELGKSPDFIFPSQEAYRDASFPTEKLRMLATKTSCKDRWRQILNEADRIPVKHLLTLQEGISVNQFREMKSAKVVLVVPSPKFKFFPSAIQSDLVTLESFIADIRLQPQLK
jgi:hypothetical protein